MPKTSSHETIDMPHTHTPGSWTYGESDLSQDGNLWFIAAEISRDRFSNVAETTREADARLIAAAPELLASLKQQTCRACLRCLGNPPLGHDPCPVCAPGCAAIAKAEGRAV